MNVAVALVALHLAALVAFVGVIFVGSPRARGVALPPLFAVLAVSAFAAGIAA